MAVSTEEYVQEKFGMDIPDVIRMHQRQFLTIAEIAVLWRCSEMTVRRIFERYSATTKTIAFIGDERCKVLANQ